MGGEKSPKKKTKQNNRPPARAPASLTLAQQARRAISSEMAPPPPAPPALGDEGHDDDDGAPFLPAAMWNSGAGFGMLAHLFSRPGRAADDEPCPMDEGSDEEVSASSDDEEEEEEEEDEHDDSGDAASSGSSDDKEEAEEAAGGSGRGGDDFARPPPCGFLRAGAVFAGKQAFVAPRGAAMNADSWAVTVAVHDVDWASGRVAGTMTGFAVPCTRPGAPPAPPPPEERCVKTALEGFVVDNANHTLVTDRWGATRADDCRYWRRLGAFAAGAPAPRGAGSATDALADGRLRGLAERPVVYLRLKETAFVGAAADAGISIHGFYYAALNRADGSVRAFYFDASLRGSPLQELRMTAVAGEHGAACSAGYALR